MITYTKQSDGLLIGDVNDNKKVDFADYIVLRAYVTETEGYERIWGKRETQFDPMGG